MAKQIRPVIVYGNDTTLYIRMKRFDKSTGDYIDFNMEQVTDLSVSLICSQHNTDIPLTFTVDGNLITCAIEYRLLHPNASYGIIVEGIDEEQKHFRFEMLSREGFLVVSNTSGMKTDDNIETIDIQGRVGWGISYNGDLTNYYTKSEVDNLIAEIEIDLSDYYTKEEINQLVNQFPTKSEIDTRFNDYYTKTQTNSLLSAKQDTLVSGSNIKTINNESILGSGNIDIQGGSEQVQSDWTQTDTTEPSYIKNKPDLSIYATKTELDDKQDELESGVNIKTINNLSLLGSGNIDIQGGGSVEPIIVTYGETISNEILAKILEQKADVIMYNGTASIYVPLETIHTTYLRFTTNQPDNNNTFSTSIYTYTINTSSWNMQVKAFYDTLQINNALDDKQDELESGVNIKTINNLSLLGSGNIDIQGGGGDYSEQFETTADALWDLNNRIERSEKVTDKKLSELKETTTVQLDTLSEEVNTQLDIVTNTLVEQSGFTKLELTNTAMYPSKKGRLRPCGIVNLTDIEPSSFADNEVKDHDWLAGHYNRWKTKIQENLGSGAVVLAFNGMADADDSTTPKASGDASICAGLGSKSLGLASVAMGQGSVANGVYSIALGLRAETSELTGSFACGYYSLANADTQFAVGNGGGYNSSTSTTSKHNALEIKQNGDIYIADTSYTGEYYEAPMIKLQDALGGGGSGTQSDWNETDTTSLAYIQNKPTIQDPGFIKVGNGLVNSLSINYNTNIGSKAVIEGDGSGTMNMSESSGYLSHSEGQATKAQNTCAHAEGMFTIANKMGSHAEGRSTMALGDYAHAEGESTSAGSVDSHAEGYGTSTSGMAAHAEGYYTQATNQGEHASGQFNVSTKTNTTFGDSGNTLFSVGNGTNASTRHNAFEIRQNGDIYITLNGSDIKLQDLLSQLATACNITI